MACLYGRKYVCMGERFFWLFCIKATNTYSNPSATKKGIWWNAKPSSFVYYPVLLPILLNIGVYLININHYTLKYFFYIFAKIFFFFTQKPRGVYTICPLVNNTVWSIGDLLRDFRCSHHTHKMVCGQIH